ncbi:MAG: FtsX-like permease family protein, partial [Lysobacterales bacterium]
MLAVRLATASALDGFERAADALGGRATHALLAGPAGVPDDAWRWLRIEAGVRSAAPLVQGWVERTDAPGRWLQLIGVDPWAEAPLARGGARLGDWPAQLTTQPDAVLASSALARRLQLAVGDRLTIRAGGRTQSLRIAGRFEADDDAAAERLIADIATAQAVLGRAGRLDRIDLVLDDAAAAALAARLPPPFRLETAAARAGELGRLTAAFRFNLDALSLLALLVGAFLIRNTLEFAVVRRRPLLGLLRALGVTRRELLGLIALEAAVLGLLGSALGLLLGALLARGLTGLVGRTLAEVYHALDAVTLALTPGALAAAAALGLAATLAAAVRPALAAADAPAGSAANRAAEQHESAHPPQRA